MVATLEPKRLGHYNSSSTSHSIVGWVGNTLHTPTMVSPFTVAAILTRRGPLLY